MEVDIFISEENGTTKVQVPWLPASIEYMVGEKVFASYNIINRGEVAVPTGTGLAKISWESQLPGEDRTDDSLMRGEWQDPAKYHDLFYNWLSKGTLLNIIVTGYPINKNVYLSSYTATPAGGFGDIEYSIEFTEVRDIEVKFTKKNKDKSNSRSSKTYTTYTIKKNDTLWKISKKKLGKGKRWKEIYKLNKTVIEKAAKKNGRKSSNNGHWIYPGTKIKLPKK